MASEKGEMKTFIKLLFTLKLTQTEVSIESFKHMTSSNHTKILKLPHINPNIFNAKCIFTFTYNQKMNNSPLNKNIDFLYFISYFLTV